MSGPLTAAIVGSFRRFYDDILRTRVVFVDAGWEVSTPVGGRPLDPTAEFIVFDTDAVGYDAPTIETLAVHRILRADLVYVCAPAGYVGRTTCYEVGRAIQAHRPIYFSDMPADLPLRVPPSAIISADDLVASLQSARPRTLFAGIAGSYAALEERLISGDYTPE